MNLIINYNDNRWKNHKIDFSAIADAIARDSRFEIRDSEISIILTNDREIRRLNKQYRGIDRATNVLSFETGDDVLLGDVYISYDTVMKEAGDTDFINHTTHMVVHGILHLLGYDHINDADADKMESREIKILKKLGIENPYRVTRDKRQETRDKRVENLSLVTCLLSLTFGAVASLGFAPFNLWWATLIGIGGAYWLMDKKYTPFLFGAVYAMASFWWVTNSIYVVPELAAQFAVWTAPAIIGIGLVGSLIFSLPFVLTRCIDKSPITRPIVFACFWTLVLWLREWIFTGFPWNPIANITLPFDVLANSMSLWGAIGLTFVIVGLGAAIVEGIRHKAHGIKRFIPLIIFLSLSIIGCVFGYNNIKKSEVENHKSEIIRIVQPAQSAAQKATHSREDAMARAAENVENLVRLAKNDTPAHSRHPSARGEPGIIVFPETSYPYLVVDENLPMSVEFNVPIIIGTMSYANGNLYNSLAVARDGKIEHLYSKSHLVPFGEYRPFGDIVPTPGQLTSGGGAEIINVSNISFAPAICYEIIFSDSLVPRGQNPGMIINITNDTWFGKTPGTFQHLDMVRRYAIESGLPIVRANYSGISAFVAADGKIISQLPVGEPGVLDGVVYGAHITPYRAIGRDIWMIIILSFAAMSVLLLKWTRKC